MFNIFCYENLASNRSGGGAELFNSPCGASDQAGPLPPHLAWGKRALAPADGVFTAENKSLLQEVRHDCPMAATLTKIFSPYCGHFCENPFLHFLRCREQHPAIAGADCAHGASLWSCP
ncbi:hypothetical protein [Massilia sp. TWR1-2-2]|uniref:hypothetical protein n=1 Tax=Massilia sp. TWR1-2-2 TaxID=2804584 RepID=UPI003CFA83B9